MYAVIESGGKQYRVELGSEIQVDRLEAQPGDTITLDRVLLVADGDAATVGRPFVDGAVVNADVVDQARGEKIIVFKYRPKARRRVKKGFRASLTTLRISDIAFGGSSAATEAAKDERRREQADREAEEAAAQKAAADQALASRLAEAEVASDPETATPKRTRAAKSSNAGSKKAAVKPEESAATPDPEATAATPEEPPAAEPPAVEAAAEPPAAEPPAAEAADDPATPPTDTQTNDKDE
jgi:large subunit ribosomal protein L21